jgi:predicted  nucleic acid-binding Zn-ribbon protein
LEKKLLEDAAFIETAETVEHCHREVVEAMDRKIEVTKDRIKAQEEVLALSLSAEEAIDDRIDTLENELKPLVKRKRNMQMDIQYDVSKLIRTRTYLTRLRRKTTPFVMKQGRSPWTQRR